jgi:hypothetical protein
MIAQHLIAWTQRLAFDGELAVCEPKTLRDRLLHTAARLVFHACRVTLRLPRCGLGRMPCRRLRPPGRPTTTRALSRRRAAPTEDQPTPDAARPGQHPEPR